MDIVLRMVKEWSKEPNILNKSRAEMLFNPKDGLQLRTYGYQWLKSNEAGAADRIICVKPDNKYTVSEEFGLGKVDNLWVVASSSNKLGEDHEDELPEHGLAEDVLESEPLLRKTSRKRKQLPAPAYTQ